MKEYINWLSLDYDVKEIDGNIVIKFINFNVIISLNFYYGEFVFRVYDKDNKILFIQEDLMKTMLNQDIGERLMDIERLDSYVEELK
jgi:hypothetical protein